MHNPFVEFERCLNPEQRRKLRKLTSPEIIQQYLDGIPYCSSDLYRSPLSVFNGGKACCMEGGLLAALVLHRLGYPPMILVMIADHDDDHVLAVYKCRNFWGSISKSDFVGLRARPPVYRTLHELVLSYFQSYYNEKARFTLRSYSLPLRLDRLKNIPWTVDDNAVNRISDAIDRKRVIPIISPRLAKALPRVDKITYRAGLVGSGHYSSYRYYDKK
jgi:hypothetical protein